MQTLTSSVELGLAMECRMRELEKLARDDHLRWWPSHVEPQMQCSLSGPVAGDVAEAGKQLLAGSTSHK